MNSARRLPISCENCRQRKIRCLISDERAPCDTCQRRGYASTCQFRREPFSKSLPANYDLQRQISDLSDLLKQSIGLTAAALEHQRDQTGPTPSKIDGDSAFRSPAVTPSNSKKSTIRTWKLIKSGSNHVRCIPFNRVGDENLLQTMQEPIINPAGIFPFMIDHSDAHQNLIHALPAMEHCDRLKCIFLNVFSPLFHILHVPTFEANYLEFKTEPRSAPLSFLALLFVILSLAVTSLVDEDPLLTQIASGCASNDRRLDLATSYRTAAMKCLNADNFLIQHNLCTLQALVFQIYAMSHAGGPVWTLLGLTLHIAIALGCSVDPEELNVDIVEAEERRRCWAALVMLFTIQSTYFGYTLPFHIEADVALPADLDDEDLLIPPGILPGNILSTPRRLTEMSYLLCKFRLYNLGFEICQRSSAAPLQPRASTMNLDEKLHKELKRHISLFEGVTDMPPYQAAHFYIVSNYTHHLYLLLHRPYLGMGQGPVPATPDYSLAHTRESCERCNESAMKILSNFESFHRDDKLISYHWYIDGLGSFQAFIAVTTLLIIMNRDDASATTILAMTTAVSSCMDIFRTRAAKSDVCAKALALLEPWVQGQLSRSQQCSLATPSTDMENYPIFDDWDSVPQIVTFMRELSSEQWLLPSAFPWVSPDSR